MNDTSARPTFATTNPATLAAGKTYTGHSAEDAARMARLAAEAQRDWRRAGFEQRAGHMRKAATVLRSRREEFAGLMTEEMGKTVTDGWPRWTSAPAPASTSPTRPPPTWPASRWRSRARRRSSPSTRSAWCSR